jgi:nicotinate-nucleotide pyrophosphorylase (carboxylating)
MSPAGNYAGMSGFSASEAVACRRLVELGLAEDVGTGKDLTSAALVEASAHGEGDLVARAPGVLAGLPAVAIVSSMVDGSISLRSQIRDRQMLEAGTVVASLAGPARSLLACERLVLNFLNHLSGVATLTRRFVDAVAGTRCQVYDTRKTLPGWRLLEKYAVRQGGGHNHRMGLFDAVLIKDNHLAYWRGEHDGQGRTLAEAVRHARAAAPSAAFVEIEVDTLDQLRDAFEGRPDAVLLDNMDVESLRRAVTLRDRLAPGVILEASGGVTLQNVAAIAATGIDRVSVGALTQSAPALDIAMDWKLR